MHIHYIKHVPFEGLASIQEWIDENKFSQEAIQMYDANYSFPNPEDVEFLIIMGGPMGVYEQENYPWIKKERTFIQQVIKADKPVLGICLGAQFIASALGAQVYPGTQKEIGWMPIKTHSNFPPFKSLEELNVLHWHGDTFDLPEHAQSIASSVITPNQAFLIHSNVLGLQFHLEMMTESVESIITHCGHELTEGMPTIQNQKTILEHTLLHQDGSKKIMFEILDFLVRKST